MLSTYIFAGGTSKLKLVFGSSFLVFLLVLGCGAETPDSTETDEAIVDGFTKVGTAVSTSSTGASSNFLHDEYITLSDGSTADGSAVFIPADSFPESIASNEDVDLYIEEGQLDSVDVKNSILSADTSLTEEEAAELEATEVVSASGTVNISSSP